MLKLFTPPWISYRSYEDSDGQFALIGNAKLHELIFMEDFHVNIMNDVVLLGLQKNDILNKYPEHRDDANNIIEELIENEILITQLPTNKNFKSTAYPHPLPNPFGDEEKSADYVALESMASSRIERAGYLFSFFWEITYKCNEACIHCYNPGAAHKKGDKNKRKTDLISKNETIELLDDLVKIGVFRITLSGGEAFLHKDFFFIMEEAKKRNFQVMIFTNGLLLNDKNLDKLEALYPDDVGITIYTDSEQRHDDITRIKGSHKKSLDALEELSRRGIRTHVKTPLMKNTAADFLETQSLITKIGTRHTVDGYLTAGNDNNLGPMELNLDINQIAELAFVSGSPFFVDKSNNFGKRYLDENQSVCNAGCSVMSITPNGKITPCPALPLEVADIREENMVSVWGERNNLNKWQPKVRPPKIDNTVRAIKIFDSDNPAIAHKKISSNRPGSLAEWRSIKLKNYVECGSHERCLWCNSKCPGAAMNETGDPLEKSEVQCKIAFAKMIVGKALEAGETKNQILDMVKSQYV